MSRKRRLNALARRVGAEEAPLSHITDIKEFDQAASRLSDAQLIDAIQRTEREEIQRMSDDALLTELAKVRQEDRS